MIPRRRSAPAAHASVRKNYQNRLHFGHCTLSGGSIPNRNGALDLSTSLTYVKGVGPARAAMLEAKGLVTVEDLLGYAPFRYEDRSNVKTIAQLAPGEMATVIAEVRSAKLAGIQRRNLGLFEAPFTDCSRRILVGKWFHGAYLANVFAPGQKVALSARWSSTAMPATSRMLHPEFEILSGDDDDGEAALHAGRIVPIYEAVAKLTTRVLRSLMHRMLSELAAASKTTCRQHIAQRLKHARPLDRDSRHRTSRRRTPTSGCSTPSARPRSSG